jgi:hypothetical protein
MPAFLPTSIPPAQPERREREPARRFGRERKHGLKAAARRHVAVERHESEILAYAAGDRQAATRVALILRRRPLRLRPFRTDDGLRRRLVLGRAALGTRQRQDEDPRALANAREGMGMPVRLRHEELEALPEVVVTMHLRRRWRRQRARHAAAPALGPPCVHVGVVAIDLATVPVAFGSRIVRCGRQQRRRRRGPGPHGRRLLRRWWRRRW